MFSVISGHWSKSIGGGGPEVGGGGGGGVSYFFKAMGERGMMIGLINITNVLQNHTVYHLDQKGSRQRNKRFCFNLFFGVVSILNRSKGNSN